MPIFKVARIIPQGRNKITLLFTSSYPIIIWTQKFDVKIFTGNTCFGVPQKIWFRTLHLRGDTKVHICSARQGFFLVARKENGLVAPWFHSIAYCQH